MVTFEPITMTYSELYPSLLQKGLVVRDLKLFFLSLILRGIALVLIVFSTRELRGMTWKVAML